MTFSPIATSRQYSFLLYILISSHYLEKCSHIKRDSVMRADRKCVEVHFGRIRMGASDFQAASDADKRQSCKIICSSINWQVFS